MGAVCPFDLEASGKGRRDILGVSLGGAGHVEGGWGHLRCLDGRDMLNVPTVETSWCSA